MKNAHKSLTDNDRLILSIAYFIALVLYLWALLS